MQIRRSLSQQLRYYSLRERREGAVVSIAAGARWQGRAGLLGRARYHITVMLTWQAIDTLRVATRRQIHRIIVVTRAIRSTPSDHDSSSRIIAL